MTRSTIESEGSSYKQQPLGRYQLLKRLAVGGMAEIFLARSTGIEGFEKYVVVKRILPQNAEDPHFIAMFLDEARLAARLDHHNIAQVYDIGQDSGQYFFAMEYLHGTDVHTLLHAAVTQNKRIPLEQAITIAAGVAAGLKYAHEKCDRDGSPLGIVHRDVAPGNIIITYEGGVKLVDFGIARAQTKSTKTDAGRIKGKLSYMSPEQCRGMSLDARSDIFSLGIVLYEMTTMTRLFRLDRRGKLGVMERIVKGDIPLPSTRAPGYPAALEQVVMRALKTAPDERYQHVGDFLRDLERVAAQERMTMSPGALAQYIREVVGYRPEPCEDDSLDNDNAHDDVDRLRADSLAGGTPTEAVPIRAPSVLPAARAPSIVASSPAGVARAASVSASMPGPTSAPLSASLARAASVSGSAAPIAGTGTSAAPLVPELPAPLESSSSSGFLAVPVQRMSTSTSGASAIPLPGASMPALTPAPGKRWRQTLALMITAAVVIALIIIAVQVEPDSPPATTPVSGAATSPGSVPESSHAESTSPARDAGIDSAVQGSGSATETPSLPQAPEKPEKKRNWDPSSPFPPSADD